MSFYVVVVVGASSVGAFAFYSVLGLLFHVLGIFQLGRRLMMIMMATFRLVLEWILIFFAKTGVSQPTVPVRFKSRRRKM